MYNVQTNKNLKDLKDVRLRVITSYIVAVTELQKLFVSLVVRHIYNNILIYIEAYYYYVLHITIHYVLILRQTCILYIARTHTHTHKHT